MGRMEHWDLTKIINCDKERLITMKQRLKKLKILFFLVGLYRFIRYSITRQVDRNILKTVNVLDSLETLDLIVANRLSVSRFGDGEFGIMFSKRNIGFQKADEHLRTELLKTFRGGGNGYYVAVPRYLVNVSGTTLWVASFWLAATHKFSKKIVQNLPKGQKDFLNTNFTRTTTEERGSFNQREYYSRIKKLWDSRTVLIVEGNQTKFGVGNTLLDNASEVLRIEVPNTDAFQYFSDIVDVVKQSLDNIDHENVLVLLAIGPTATVLVPRIASFAQTIDIGHLDMEYELYVRGMNKVGRITGKYVNEAPNGDLVENIYETDAKFSNQVIARIDK